MTCFSELLGKTITKIDGIDVAYRDKLIFHCNDGSVYCMYHSQDCCESVSVEDIIGDVDDILNTPILLAEEVTYDNEPNPDGNVGSDDDYCWTFYKLRTIRGDVTIRWLGESNGYYSTSVYFIKNK
jgi:hypothetical protein